MENRKLTSPNSQARTELTLIERGRRETLGLLVTQEGQSVFRGPKLLNEYK